MNALSLLLLAGYSLIQQPAKPAQSGPPLDAPAFKEPGCDLVSLGPNLWLDKNDKARRLLIRTSICRRDVPLEEFMCLKNTKEHESVLVAELVPEVLHAGLLATGAKTGSIAKFQPDYQPPTGEKLEITVEWRDGKEFKRARAQDWIRDGKTKKAIEFDFVFAGSQEISSPVTGKSYYLGNEGDLISVANFPGSIIDLAVKSSTDNQFQLFEAFKERIPPVNTEVIVIINPARKPGTTPEPRTAKPAE